MKIYDYSNINECNICGSVNDKLQRFIRLVLCNLKVTDTPFDIPSYSGYKLGFNLNDMVIIVNGMNYFRSKDIEYYIKKLESFNNLLAKNNIHILIIRGNDNPRFFNEELINLSNIKTIPDYSIVKLNSFNILCVGGTISMDRSWKKTQEKRIGKKLYYEDENTIFKEDELEKSISNINISCVITSYCPSLLRKNSVFKKVFWCEKDKLLFNDIKQEMATIDMIYHKLIEQNKKPHVWFYNYNSTYNSKENLNNDIIYTAIMNLSLYSINKFFQPKCSEDILKNLGSNFKKLDDDFFKYFMPPNENEVLEVFYDYPPEFGTVLTTTTTTNTTI